VTVADYLKLAIEAFVCPQACVLCDRWVANSDFSPLCSFCLDGIRPLRGPFCHKCGVPVPGNLLESHALCSSCREGSFRFSEARSWGLYEGELRRVIQAFKFDGHLRLVAPLADFLRQCQSEHFSNPDCIVPVPLHPKRRRQRGFDQTLLLAKSLSAKANIPLLRCIRRARNTVPQFGLNHEDRRRNIKGAFELTKGQGLEGKSILIVDDVMTTGATVEEMCRVLQTKAKPDDVRVLTVARVSKLSYSASVGIASSTHGRGAGSSGICPE